jgi:hypothetical protein
MIARSRSRAIASLSLPGASQGRYGACRGAARPRNRRKWIPQRHVARFTVIRCARRTRSPEAPPAGSRSTGRVGADPIVSGACSGAARRGCSRRRQTICSTGQVRGGAAEAPGRAWPLAAAPRPARRARLTGSVKRAAARQGFPLRGKASARRPARPKENSAPECRPIAGAAPEVAEPVHVVMPGGSGGALTPVLPRTCSMCASHRGVHRDRRAGDRPGLFRRQRKAAEP